MNHNRLSRIIPAPQVKAAVPVRFGSLSGEPPMAESAQAVAPDDEFAQANDEAGYRLAYEDGYDEGYRVGQEQAQREGQQRLQDYVKSEGRQQSGRMESLLVSAEHGLVIIQHQIAQTVLELACDIARQVIRREVAINPVSTLAVVREALTSLGTESRAVTVRLHPVDYEVLTLHLRTNKSLSYVTWQVDNTLQPGDCMVESGNTTVDGTLGSRWKRALARLGMDLSLIHI